MLKKKVTLFNLTLLILLLVFASVAVAAPGASGIIQPNELKDLIQSNNVVVMDVSETSKYDLGHIPGAIQVNTADFFETIGGVAKMAASQEKLAKLLSEKGITPNTNIAIYSQSNDTKHATRFWWTLNMYGHKNVRVLNGGLENWKASGYDISTESSVPTKAVYPSTELVVNPNIVAVLDEVKAALAKGTPVIDCRDQKQFDTKHIPGAMLIPEADMYNSDGTFKGKDELKSYFAAKGLTEDTPIIAYCNSGTTATVQYLVLTEILGYKNVQNYDGSLNEWNAINKPVEQPKPQKELPVTGGNPLAIIVTGFLMTGLGLVSRKQR